MTPSSPDAGHDGTFPHAKRLKPALFTNELAKPQAHTSPEGTASPELPSRAPPSCGNTDVALARACAATASVLWHPAVCSIASGVPGVEECARAVHLEVFAQWRVLSSQSSQRHSCLGQWLPPQSSCAMLAARAMHRLSVLHLCSWQLAVCQPASLCGAGFGPVQQIPADAHLPVHCAVAHGGAVVSRGGAVQMQ